MEKQQTYAYSLEGNLYINLTNGCTNSCTFCLRNNAEGICGNNLILTSNPTASQVLQQIEAVDFSYKQAVFCGYGEPTMRLEVLVQVAQQLKSKGVYVRINTNGHSDIFNFGTAKVNAQNKNTADIIKPFVDEVSISLNAETAQKYQEVCHSIYGEAGFNHMLDFAKSCVAAGIKTTLSVVDIIGQQAIEKCRILAQNVGASLKVRAHITNNLTYA